MVVPGQPVLHVVGRHRKVVEIEQRQLFAHGVGRGEQVVDVVANETVEARLGVLFRLHLVGAPDHREVLAGHRPKAQECIERFLVAHRGVAVHLAGTAA